MVLEGGVTSRICAGKVVSGAEYGWLFAKNGRSIIARVDSYKLINEDLSKLCENGVSNGTPVCINDS